MLIAQADWPNMEEAKIHRFLKATNHHVRREWFKEGTEPTAIISWMHQGSAGLVRWRECFAGYPNRINTRLSRALSIVL